jgi:hypothetical protein
LEQDFLSSVGSFSDPTLSSTDLALKAHVFLSNHPPFSGFFNPLSFSLSLPHLVFFLGFWLSSSLSHFVGLASIFPSVYCDHVTETEYAG